MKLLGLISYHIKKRLISHLLKTMDLIFHSIVFVNFEILASFPLDLEKRRMLMTFCDVVNGIYRSVISGKGTH